MVNIPASCNRRNRQTTILFFLNFSKNTIFSCLSVSLIWAYCKVQQMFLWIKMDSMDSGDIFSYPKHSHMTHLRICKLKRKTDNLDKKCCFGDVAKLLSVLTENNARLYSSLGTGIPYHWCLGSKNIHLKDFWAFWVRLSWCRARRYTEKSFKNVNFEDFYCIVVSL